MHRLMTSTAELASDAPALSRDAMRHLGVLRPKEGEMFELFDGRGNYRACRYEAGRLVASGALMTAAAAIVPVTAFLCITKGSRWDWTVEKATELGVSRIVPVLSARTIVRIDRGEYAAKRERWLRIAEDAARQSDAKWIPEIDLPTPFRDALQMAAATRCLVGAIADPPPRTIAEELAVGMGDAIFIGPEGDFSPEELAQLLAVARPVSFGTTILRAETAAIYGISIIKSAIDAMHHE